MATMNVDISQKTDTIDVNIPQKIDTIDVGMISGGYGITDHSKLKNRDLTDQHPISAITDLESALADKLSQDDLEKGIDAALVQAKASGEFDGKDGAQGEKGADGRTPVKGEDYWTTDDKAEIVEDTKEAIDLSSYAEKTELENYLPLTGGACTGGVTAPNFQTGSAADSYFQTTKMRGQGDANTYNHAVDWGYAGHDRVDFYEYGGTWNFHQCQSPDKKNAHLVGSIKHSTGWNGSAALTGTPTAPTAAEGTNTTQIATTEFVQGTLESVAMSNQDIENLLNSFV